MRDPVAEGRRAASREALELERLVHRLRQSLAGLPAPPGRGEGDDIAEDDFVGATELRALLQCLLADRLDPAIRELHALSRSDRASVPTEKGDA